MFVQDFDSVRNVENPADIEAVLSKRHRAGVNSFWLGQRAAGFPAVAIMVNGDLAHVHYFPNEGPPGFASVGGSLGLSPDGETVFCHDNTEEICPMMNYSVVPFSDALKAAQEFAVSNAMPKCLQWNSLVEGE
jgi:hypothetical protein